MSPTQGIKRPLSRTQNLVQNLVDLFFVPVICAVKLLSTRHLSLPSEGSIDTGGTNKYNSHTDTNSATDSHTQLHFQHFELFLTAWSSTSQSNNDISNSIFNDTCLKIQFPHQSVAIQSITHLVASFCLGYFIQPQNCEISNSEGNIFCKVNQPAGIRGGFESGCCYHPSP